MGLSVATHICPKGVSVNAENCTKAVVSLGFDRGHGALARIWLGLGQRLSQFIPVRAPSAVARQDTKGLVTGMYEQR